jgi:hypothetical protein
MLDMGSDLGVGHGRTLLFGRHAGLRSSACGVAFVQSTPAELSCLGGSKHCLPRRRSPRGGFYVRCASTRACSSPTVPDIFGVTVLADYLSSPTGRQRARLQQSRLQKKRVRARRPPPHPPPPPAVSGCPSKYNACALAQPRNSC